MISAARKWWISLAISVILLTLLGSQIDLKDLLKIFRNISWVYLAPVAVIYLLGLFLRSLRYRVLLNHPISMGPLVLVTQVRNMFADLFPARIGTVSYLYLVVKRYGVNFGDALSSFISVFFLDLAAIAPLLGLALLSLLGSVKSFSLAILFVFGAILFLGSILALMIMPWGIDTMTKILQYLKKPWPEKTSVRLQELNNQYHKLRARHALWPAFGLSLGIRLAKYTNWYLLLRAVLANHPDAPESLPYFHVLAGVFAAESSSALPISGLAGFGTYETAWAIGFGALGFTKTMAITTGMATHLLSQMLDYGLGIGALLWIYKPPSWKLTVKKLLLVAMIFLMPIGALAVPRFLNRRLPPSSGHAITDSKEKQAFLEAAEMIGKKATMIWSSNRSGNHEIYALDLPDGTLRTLTEDPHVDFYSRFSPDGQKILFLRSRGKWASFRERSKWDVWLMDSHGQHPERLLEKSFHPSWWPDGHSIVYTKEKLLYRHYLDTNRQELLADGQARPFQGSFHTPRISPDGMRVALTILGSFRGVVIWDIGAETMLPVDEADGCQLDWNADGTDLIWVSGGGHGKNRILHSLVEKGKPAVIIDLPGEYSHEYFLG